MTFTKDDLISCSKNKKCRKHHSVCYFSWGAFSCLSVFLMFNFLFLILCFGLHFFFLLSSPTSADYTAAKSLQSCLTLCNPYNLHYFPLPWWLSWLRIHLQCRWRGFNPWVEKIPWRREQLSMPGFWPGEFHGLYSPQGSKELDTTVQLSLSPSP